MADDLRPLCVICQNEVWEEPVPWHGANAHGLCADQIEDADEVEYGDAFGRAFQQRHEAGTCASKYCVCRGKDAGK